MAFTTIPTGIIESGDPVTSTLWNTYVKDNFDDHEDRITDLEAGSAVSYMPLEWMVNGPLKTKDDVGFTRIPFNITLLAGRLISQVAGSSGTLSIDMEYKRGAGAWTTIFSVKPQITSTSDYQIDTGTLSVTSILSGDLIRMNIDTIQTGSPEGCLGILEFQKTT